MPWILWHLCMHLNTFQGDAEIVLNWLLKLFWLLWSEFSLILHGAVWDVQKAPGLHMCCPLVWSCTEHVPGPLQNLPNRRESFSHLPSYPRKAITAFSNFLRRTGKEGWFSCVSVEVCACIFPCSFLRRKVIRAGNDYDKVFIFSILHLYKTWDNVDRRKVWAKRNKNKQNGDGKNEGKFEAMCL